MQTDLFLRFDSRTAAFDALKSKGLIPDFMGDEIPVDGPNFAIDVVFDTGEIWENRGTIENPDYVKLPGFHVNLRWIGPVESVPDFGPARITPSSSVCVFAGGNQQGA